MPECLRRIGTKHIYMASLCWVAMPSALLPSRSKGGGKAAILQKLLGYSKLETTEIYVDLASDDVVTAHRRYSPGDLLCAG